MQAEDEGPSFLIWGVDNVVYGPVDLPVLVNWVQEQRVIAGTWIYLHHEDAWLKASEIPELQMFFRKGGGAMSLSVGTPDAMGTAMALKPGSLRRVKILACLSDSQLEQFASFMEVQRVRQWEEIIRENAPGDAMFLILEGEVRVRLMIDGKETILSTLGAGEFFGEMALFDHGPRSADVIANLDCLMLRVGAAAVQRLTEKHPEVAAPFLFAVSRTLMARMRSNTKRIRDSVVWSRQAGAGSPA